MAGRKRVYAMPVSASTRPFKKRKFSRRRFVRGRKSSSYSANSSRAGGFGFRRRKTNKRAWRRHLFNSSMSNTHYRANASVGTEFGTPASRDQMLVTLQTSRRFAGAAFFTTAGGAIDPDGGTMPTFAPGSDITVRGGVYGIRISNNPNADDVDKDAIMVHVYHIWTSKNLTSGSVPSSTVAVGWDPSLIADFQTKIGRVTFKKSFLVREGDVFTIERKMPVQKIDQTEYAATYSEPAWLIAYGNVSATTAKAVTITTYYNMSFVGDVV